MEKSQHYTRVNGSTIGKHVGSAVRLVGTIEEFKGDHGTIKTTDDQLILANNFKNDASFEKGTWVEVIGLVSEDNSLQVMEVYNIQSKSPIDKNSWNEMIKVIDTHPNIF